MAAQSTHTVDLSSTKHVAAKTCECHSNRAIDMKTPRNVPLTAFYRRSFAFFTVKKRMPIIITNLIDNLARNKKQIFEKYGEGAPEELKKIIGEISEYRYEVQTNKPIKLLIADAPDVKIYNDYIERQAVEEGHTTHFHTHWLLTECYMYRRIRQSFETKEALKNYDPFENQKQQSFDAALPLIEKMGDYLVLILSQQTEADKQEFIRLIKLNLWGNKCDLSLSLGKVGDDNTLFDIEALDPFIICDHSEKMWHTISAESNSTIADIVFDNAGYEVFTDLCLADYMITKKLVKSCRLYVKAMPWFISDVMKHDLYWILDQLKTSQKDSLKILGHKWSEYIANGTWSIIISDFWTLPLDFAQMAKADPDLYKQMAEAKAVFFKGDLNYRKLFGDINWDPRTSIDEGLRNFNPTNLFIIRTIKADIVCGIESGIADVLSAKDEKWQEKGDYGLIQFSNKIVSIE